MKEKQEDFLSINHQKHPMLENKTDIIHIELLSKGSSIGITLKKCKYYNLPYCTNSTGVNILQSYKTRVKKKYIDTDSWIKQPNCIIISIGRFEIKSNI